VTTTLTDRLRTVEVHEAGSADGLQVFGLRWRPGNGPGYRTLDEALAAGTLEVTEVSEGGSVPQLKVINRGDEAVFLMAGEQLVGARQNRILNTSVLVAARSELVIPVSCVEAGRWGYSSPKFASGGTLSHGALRKLLSGHVHDSYARGAGAMSQQGEVWQEISGKLARMGSASPSAALQQAYEDHRTRLEGLLGKLAAPEGCCGAAFAVGGRVAGADLFDRPGTLAKLWLKLARAHAIDALEKAGEAPAPLPAAAVSGWLHGAAGAEARAYKSPGLGEDVRLKGAGVVGGGLVVDGEPVHAELFAL
jgi:hypothetical protein